MKNVHKPFGLALASAALGLGVLGMNMANTDDANAGWFGKDELRCEINVKPGRHGVELEGLVFSRSQVSGHYEFSVSQAGLGSRSLINQSGDFEAVSSGPVSLGTVMLGGDGGGFIAKLQVHASGKTYRCTQRVGRT
jgi:hypothetical protein